MLRRFMNNCEIYFYVILLNNEKILINNQINEIINNKIDKQYNISEVMIISN